jgi:hypothetical protein
VSDEENVGRTLERRLAAGIVGDCKVYVSVEEVGPSQAGPGDEHEIGARRPRVEAALDGMAEFAGQIVKRFEQTDAQKVTVEFGCDIVLESGTFFAVIGKASSTSSITVGLEWVRPTKD